MATPEATEALEAFEVLGIPFDVGSPDSSDEESVEGKIQDRAPLLLPSFRRNLFQAVQRKDADALASLLASASPEEAATAIDEIGEETRYGNGYQWPLTVLSNAIWGGEEEIIRILVRYTAPRDFSEAINFEKAKIPGNNN